MSQSRIRVHLEDRGYYEVFSALQQRQCGALSEYPYTVSVFIITGCCQHINLDDRNRVSLRNVGPHLHTNTLIDLLQEKT